MYCNMYFRGWKGNKGTSIYLGRVYKTIKIILFSLVTSQNAFAVKFIAEYDVSFNRQQFATMELKITNQAQLQLLFKNIKQISEPLTEELYNNEFPLSFLQKIMNLKPEDMPSGEDCTSEIELTLQLNEKKNEEKLYEKSRHSITYKSKQADGSIGSGSSREITLPLTESVTKAQRELSAETQEELEPVFLFGKAMLNVIAVLITPQSAPHSDTNPATVAFCNTLAIQSENPLFSIASLTCDSKSRMIFQRCLKKDGGVGCYYHYRMSDRDEIETITVIDSQSGGMIELVPTSKKSSQNKGSSQFTRAQLLIKPSHSHNEASMPAALFLSDASATSR